MTEQQLQEIEALVRKAEELSSPYSRDEALLASGQVADHVPALIAEVRRLRALAALAVELQDASYEWYGPGLPADWATCTRCQARMPEGHEEDCPVGRFWAEARALGVAP